MTHVSAAQCSKPILVELDLRQMHGKKRCMGVWVQALLGGGASVVLEGQRVVPTRTQDAGFRFQYSHIGPAISNIFR